MTINTIQKKCPECGNTQCDIIGAVKVVEEFKKGKGMITKFKSYNLYKCLKCRQRFLEERTPAEQALTEKYIKSSEIKLH